MWEQVLFCLLAETRKLVVVMAQIGYATHLGEKNREYAKFYVYSIYIITQEPHAEVIGGDDPLLNPSNKSASL